MTVEAKTTEPAESPKVHKSKVLKWLAVSVGLILSVFVLLLLLVYFTLRSGSFTQTAVPELKPYLAPFGIQLNKIGLLRFDLLKSIVLQDLELQWQDSELGDVSLALGQFDFEYSFSDLLGQRVEISQLSLQDVKISAHIRQPQAAAIDTTEEKPMGMKEIEELIKNPPLLLNVKGIALRNIQLDITLEQEDGLLQYQGELSEANMAVSWLPEKLSGLFNMAIGQQAEINQLRMVSKVDGQDVEVIAKPSLVFATNWVLENNNQQWQIKDSDFKFDLKLENAELVPSAEIAEPQLVQLGSFDVQLNNTFSSFETANIADVGKGLENLFPIAVNSEISSNLLDFNISNLKQADLSLTSQLTHRLQATVNGLLNPFNSQVPELSFKLTESFKLKNLDMQLAGQTIKTDSVSWALNSQGKTELDDNKNTTLDISLNADLKSSLLNVELPGTANTEPDVKLNVEPEFHLSSTAKLGSFEQPLEQLVALLKPEFIIKNLSASIKEGKKLTNYKLTSGKISAITHYDKKQINLDTDIDLEKLTMPELKKTFSLKNKTKLATDLDLKLVSVNTEIRLDKYQLLTAALELDNKEKDFRLKHDIKLQLSPQLVDYHDAAKELEIIGEPHLTLIGNSRIKHNGLNIQTVDFALLERWLLETNGKLLLTQQQAPVIKDGVLLSGPVTLDYAIDNKQNYQVDLDLAVAGIKTPPLETFIPVKLKSKNNLTWPLSVTKSVSQLDIKNQTAFDIDLLVNDKKHSLNIDSKINLNVKPEWQVYLKDLKELESLGALQTQFDLNANIKHPFKSILDFDPDQLKKLSARILLNSTISQDTATPGSMLVLAKTATINQDLNWSAEQLKWQTQLDIPELLLPDVAAISGMHSTIQLNANSGLMPSSAAVEWLIDEGNISLLSADKDKSTLEVGHVLTPLSLVSSANWTEKDLHIEKLSLKLGSSLLDIQTAGSASLDGKNAQIETTIVAQLRNKLFNEPAVSGTGSLKIPLRLTMLDGKQVALEGEMQFDKLSIAIDDLNVQNVNGVFKLEEELLLANDNAKFRYLLEANPFQRVDFSRIQPYLDTSSISIEKITAADLTVGPVLASVLLKQNMFSLQQFDIDLFSGHSAGQFYLDVRPGAWKLGLLSRITNLDPRQMLAKDSPLRNSKLSPINSRTAIVFNVHKRLMEGEVVISQISRDQLLQLLDVVDPAHEDEQMAQLRQGLRISYPKSVEVIMQRGLMSLKVEIAGVPKAIRVTGLPLTPMIQQFASEALAEIDKIPLQ